MSKEVQDILFDCLRDIIYDSDKASLNIDDLPKSYHQLGKGLLFLAECVKEQKNFAKSLVRGDFEENVPSVENGIAAPLKEVHGILKHVVWQTEQVAKGDYSQHLDYFGEFSDSFNTMVSQLKYRQERLEIEKNNLKLQNQELVNLQNLFKDITINAPYRIIALNSVTKDITYLNKAALKTKENHSHLFDRLYKIIISLKESQSIVMIDDLEETPIAHYYQISMSGTQNDDASLLFVIMDITDEVNEENNLEKLAYMDELTGLPNRRYGREHINGLSAENERYAIGFIDIDYLKYCNDVFGHEAGDKYIVEIADALKKFIQNDGIVCRMGGDEFMVIMHDMDASTLERELAEIRGEFVDTKIEPFEKSFSYGVEGRRKNDERSNADILARADMKMYKFKAAHKRKMKYPDSR